MKAYDLLKSVMENSKAAKKVPGELANPKYDNLDTPDNHVGGKRGKEVDGKKGLGDKSQKANKGDPGMPKAHEKRQTKMFATSAKKVANEAQDVSRYLISSDDPKVIAGLKKNFASYGETGSGIILAAEDAKRAAEALRKNNIPVDIEEFEWDEFGDDRDNWSDVQEGMKFDKKPVADEMGKQQVKKEQPAKSKSVRSSHPDHETPKAEVGKPDQNKAWMQARQVSVKTVKENLSDLEKMLGTKLDIGEAFLAADEGGRGDRYSYDMDSGGVVITDNKTGKSVFLQPGDDAEEFLNTAETLEQKGKFDMLQHLMDQYSEVMEGAGGKPKRPFRESEDWYERRRELEPDMIFIDYQGEVVRLDRTVPGDATQWYVDFWDSRNQSWSSHDDVVEPGDLAKRLPDDWNGQPISESNYPDDFRGTPYDDEPEDREIEEAWQRAIEAMDGELRSSVDDFSDITDPDDRQDMMSDLISNMVGVAKSAVEDRGMSYDLFTDQELKQEAQKMIGKVMSAPVTESCGCQELDQTMGQFGFAPGMSNEPGKARFDHDSGRDVVVFVMNADRPEKFEFVRDGKTVDGGVNPERLERILQNLFGSPMSEDSGQNGLFANVWKRRRQGKPRRKPGDKNYPSDRAWKKSANEGWNDDSMPRKKTIRKVRDYHGPKYDSNLGGPNVANEEEGGEDPCWDGYEQYGMKKRGGKEVPNCVPKKGKTDENLGKRMKQAAKDYWHGKKGSPERMDAETRHAKKLMKKQGMDRMQATRATRDKFGESAYLVLAGDILEWNQNGVPYSGEIVEFIGDRAVVDVGDGQTVTRDMGPVSEAEVLDEQIQIEEYKPKASHKSDKGGLTDKGRRAYNRATGSNLKRPQPGGGKRKTSYCARSKGQQDQHNIDCRKDPDKRICKARRRWDC